ncbi:hypothetical protein D8M06_01155 [Oceanobacillus halophilus]|uniref:Uncharacterized protein n=1 Tax=Oceanobacillus halophilus TaxID=930130 RepID=A0A495ABQ0_9BACI|nr:hypothetical protein D8M06_01155 [Oceanobacillus halophilus]
MSATEINYAFRGELVSLLRADALSSLTDALLPAGQGTLRQGYIARRKKWFSFFKESPCISSAKFLLYLILTRKIGFQEEQQPQT